jgi:hypothetical protein
MIQVFILLAAGILGIALGLIISLMRLKREQRFDEYQPQNMSIEPVFPAVINFDSQTFTANELAFLKKIIQLNELRLPVSGDEFRKIFNLAKLNNQSQRIQVNTILKNINLKLFFIYGIEEGIKRVSTEDDKRKKCYFIKVELIRSGIAKSIH